MFHYYFCYTFLDNQYYSQEFWTALAVIVALFTPWIVNYLNNLPKKSRLIFKDTSVVNQDSNPDTEEDLVRLLNVGRLIIKNEGKYIAKSVEAYVDRIKYDNEMRNDFSQYHFFGLTDN